MPIYMLNIFQHVRVNITASRSSIKGLIQHRSCILIRIFNAKISIYCLMLHRDGIRKQKYKEITAEIKFKKRLKKLMFCFKMYINYKYRYKNNYKLDFMNIYIIKIIYNII